MTTDIDIKKSIADLSSDDMMERARAESNLYEADQDAAPLLVEVLLHSQSIVARRKAAWIIYKMAPRITDRLIREQTISALIESTHDDDQILRGNAPWGLGVLGGNKAIAALQAAAAEGEHA